MGFDLILQTTKAHIKEKEKKNQFPIIKLSTHPRQNELLRRDQFHFYYQLNNIIVLTESQILHIPKHFNKEI